MRALKKRLTPFGERPKAAAGQAATRVVQPMNVRVDQSMPVNPMRPRIDIPVRDPDPAEAAHTALWDRGQHLARQDAWDVLGREIHEADAGRVLTPALRPAAALLAEGARADAVRAARTAIGRGEPKHAYAAIAALEANREDAPECSGVAFVAAAAHVEAGLAWRGASQRKDLAPQRGAGFDHAMKAASDLADEFDPFEWDSPLWAKLRCMVLDVDPAPSQRVCDDYEDLVDMNPRCPDHLLDMGRDLLPSRFGRFEMLQNQARRMAHRTSDIWGIGGYTWMWIGAIEQDLNAIRRVDPGVFREGVRDILDRFPDQGMVNRLAAFTGVTLPMPGAQADTMSDIARDFDWIVADRLTELHPLAWANAATPGRAGRGDSENTSTFGRGKARALSTIGARFAADLERKGHISFHEDGMHIG